MRCSAFQPIVVLRHPAANRQGLSNQRLIRACHAMQAPLQVVFQLFSAQIELFQDCPVVRCGKQRLIWEVRGSCVGCHYQIRRCFPQRTTGQSWKSSICAENQSLIAQSLPVRCRVSQHHNWLECRASHNVEPS
jgi:hypothetical protein